jgi:predicted transcriptional regulator of viral defense system
MHSKRIIKRRIARRHEPERKLIERIHVYLRKKGWRLREHKGRYVIVDLLRETQSWKIMLILSSSRAKPGC